MTLSPDKVCVLTGADECRQYLTPQLASRLETALGSVGSYGEVRLVIFKGRVRFIEIMRSESVDRHRETEEDGR